tara:strand:+ start:78 stop:1070 length:993 start_codon:yes stop_codon:yes gene_type:complete
VNLQNKILQCIGIPHTALISIILFLMILSFPIGTYLVFNSEIGNDITYEYPMNDLSVFLAGIGFQIPVEFELGDGFIVLWCLFLILFAVTIFGPKKSFANVLQSIISFGKYHQLQDNYIITAIKWFSILVVVSGVIISVQEFFGISVEKTGAPNQLIQFFQILLAPLVEEIGFRVMLIGLPLFALYSCKSSLRFFVKSLWRPWHNLDITDLKKPLLIIIIVAIFFGISHVISGEAWSAGKFAQATVSGLIIGWVYFRYGLAPAILIHWAANYFIYSYAYIVADINKIPVETAFTHSLLNGLELTLIATGVISIVILVLNYVFSKKHVLEV